MEVILETPVRITHPSCEIVSLQQPWPTTTRNNPNVHPLFSVQYPIFCFFFHMCSDDVIEYCLLKAYHHRVTHLYFPKYWLLIKKLPLFNKTNMILYHIYFNEPWWEEFQTNPLGNFHFESSNSGCSAEITSEKIFDEDIYLLLNWGILSCDSKYSMSHLSNPDWCYFFLIFFFFFWIIFEK